MPRAPGLDPLQGLRRDFLGRDVQPVVGGEIGAPRHQRPAGEVALDRVAAQEPRNAEEGRAAADRVRRQLPTAVGLRALSADTRAGGLAHRPAVGLNGTNERYP